MNKQKNEVNGERFLLFVALNYCVRMQFVVANDDDARAVCATFFCSENDWREISTGNKLFTSNDHKNRFRARRTQNRSRFSCGLAAHYSMHARLVQPILT